MVKFSYRDEIDPIYINTVKVNEYKKIKSGMEFSCSDENGENIFIRVDVVSPLIFRIRYGKKSVRNRFSYTLEPGYKDNTNFSVEEGKNAVIIDTEQMSFILNLHTARYTVVSREGDFSIRQAFNGLGTCKTPENSIKFRESLEISLPPAQTEHFFGLGEQFGSVNKKGRSFFLWNRDWYNSRGDHGYKNVPFVMSTRNYGVFLHSYGKIIFRMGDESPEYYTFETEDKYLDYFLIPGKSMKNVLQQYTSLTGRTPLVPRWAYGVWWSNERYASRQEIEEVCTRLRKEEYPADVINIDHYYWAKGYNDFLWNDNFPEPDKMIKNLKKMNFKICLWETPFINLKTKDNRLEVVDDKCSLYDEAVEKGYVLKNEDGSPNITTWWWGDGVYVDFTNPEAVKWWKELHYRLLDQGIDVFKTDDGEYVREDAHFADGHTGREMHNIYPLIYNKAVFEAVKEYSKDRGIVWGRSGYAGSQKYPVCWSGDQASRFDFLESNIRGGLSIGLSGFSAWSHDIGGFIGTPEEELFIRWTQFGTFSPFFRVHGTGKREPWLYDENIQELYKKYAKLRIRLFPFIYSLAYKSSQSGLPMMRHMALEFPHDSNVLDKDSQYMLGRCLLVAPVTRKEYSRDIYLPPGRWYDFWDKGITFSGGGFIKYEAPLERIPVIAREGAMIPLMPEMMYIDEKEINPLTIKLFPGSKGAFDLYEESGVTRLSFIRENGTVIFDCGGRYEDYILDIMDNEIPGPVHVSKERLKGLDGKAKIQAAI